LIVALGASAAVATAVAKITAAHAANIGLFFEKKRRAECARGFEISTFNMTTS